MGNNPLSYVDPYGQNWLGDKMEAAAKGLYRLMMGDTPGRYNPYAKGALDAQEGLVEIDRNANVLSESTGEAGSLAGNVVQEAAEQYVSGAVGGVLEKATARGLCKAAKSGVPALYDAKFAAQQLLEDGQVSLNRLKSFVPEGTPNTFKPSSTIQFGQKYQFEINGSKIEVKFHSPDAVAAAKFPGSASGSQWTSQIKVNGKLLGADGKFYSKPGNVTHIPIVELP